MNCKSLTRNQGKASNIKPHVWNNNSFQAMEIGKVEGKGRSCRIKKNIAEIHVLRKKSSRDPRDDKWTVSHGALNNVSFTQALFSYR